MPEHPKVAEMPSEQGLSQWYFRRGRLRDSSVCVRESKPPKDNAAKLLI